MVAELKEEKAGKTMKVYIHSYKNGIPHNHNFYSAYEGFREMGFEIIPFCSFEELSESRREDIVIGYVDTVREKLYQFGIVTPEIDYPDTIKKYLCRKIWPSTINTINSHPELWPVFVKPVEDKKFTGVVVRSPKDLIGCGTSGTDVDVTCSEILDLRAEWRVFVRYGHILDVRRYKGDWRLHYDPTVIENAISDYTDAPAGYAIDFGVTAEGKTVLIEVNDGYSLGSYGLISNYYAKLLSARWAELTDTEDECAFDLEKA